MALIVFSPSVKATVLVVQGLLSTDKGHKVLNSMEAKDAKFIDVS